MEEDLLREIKQLETDLSLYQQLAGKHKSAFYLYLNKAIYCQEQIKTLKTN